VRIFQLRSCAAITVAVGTLALASSAGAATLSVDDDREDCPAATYTSIQSAIDAAASGDTIAVCAGKYVEGTGAIGSNGLTINKNIAIKGAGADLVTIAPKAIAIPGVLNPRVRGRIAENTADLRNASGDIISVMGDPDFPARVDISGVTVDGDGVYSEAGIVYVDAVGLITRVRVTDIVTSEGNNAFDPLTTPGGYRSNTAGYGIVQVTRATANPGGPIRKLEIDSTRVDKYNAAGILISGATSETGTPVATGTRNRGIITNSQVVGRTECVTFEADGTCATVGLTTTGPLYGQDGVRVVGGATTSVTGTLVSQNLVNGTGAPTRSTVSTNGTFNAQTANNSALTQGAGIRLLGAGGAKSSGSDTTFINTIAASNVVDNAYGVLNTLADGVTPATGTTNGSYTRAVAENNWWGLNYYRGGSQPGGTQAVNAGPVISPTSNPPVPENPVNGASVADGAGFSSTSVDFFPFRDGPQSSEVNGQYIVADAPLPVNDFAPVAKLNLSATSVKPGQSVVLSTDATDDFGVKQVTFYDGSTVIGSTKTAPYSASLAIPADAACVNHALSVVAEDSSGQTVRSDRDLSVTGCVVPPPDPGPPGPPNPPAPPAAPTVAFTGAIGTIATSGASITVNPTAEAGVKSVEFFLGTRKVCTVTSAPFSCSVKPTGAETGKQTLRVVVTDALGGTASATTAVTVARFKATLSLSTKSKTIKGNKSKKTITGTLKLPAGVTAAQACKSGSATVVVKSGKKTLVNSVVKLSKSCKVTKSITVKKTKKKTTYTVNAKFGGNTVLLPISNDRRFS